MDSPVLESILIVTLLSSDSNYNDVRLVGSVTDGQGAVEMNIASYGWVRLCPEAFDLSGVCSKLGYTSTTYQTYT